MPSPSSNVQQRCFKTNSRSRFSQPWCTQSNHIKGCCSSILLYVAYQKCLEGVSIMCMPEDHAAKLWSIYCLLTELRVELLWYVCSKATAHSPSVYPRLHSICVGVINFLLASKAKPTTPTLDHPLSMRYKHSWLLVQTQVASCAEGVGVRLPVSLPGYLWVWEWNYAI